MKNFTLGVLAAFVLFVGIAATPIGSNLITFKPARPISTVCFNGYQPEGFVIKYANQGYVVVSSCEAINHTTFVVMVKY